VPGGDVVWKSFGDGRRSCSIARARTDQRLEITGRGWCAIRKTHAECHQGYEDRRHVSQGWFDVLFVLRPGTDSRSCERTAERSKNIREILSCVFKARHLLRAIAV